MALTWEWNRKIGESVHEDTTQGKRFTMSLYEGNALLITLYEYKNEDGEEMYNMHDFWIDKEHAKNVLGLNKGHKNLYMCHADYDKIVNFTFYRDKVSPNTLKTLLDLIGKGLPDVPILILPHNPSDEC